MPDPEFDPRLFLKFIDLLYYTLKTLSASQRPAYPAIKGPNSGATVMASQTQDIPLTVFVSSNRPDEAHIVELLDCDFVFKTSAAVSFVTNSAQIMIPRQASADPTTMILQCRAPSDPGGCVHRILIDVQAPPVATPPTVTVTATSGTGASLPSGMYNHTTAGLDAVMFNATPAGGVGPFTFHWTVTLGTTPTTPATTTATLGPVNLIPTGTTFPTGASVSVYVTDANSLNSPPAQLNYFFS